MSPIDRREFLRLALLAASADLVPQKAWSFAAKPLPPAASAKRIVIIGAGLAGLVAAYELTQAGHDVTILEAQMRPGGRVLTLREPFSDGLYAEAGAARIPDNHDVTLHYVKHFGLTLVPFYPDKLARIYLLRGKRIKVQPGTELDLSQVPYELIPEERRVGMSGLVQKYLGGAIRAMGDPSASDWPNGPAKAYDKITMAEFLKEQGASHGTIELLEYPYTSAGDDPISLLWNLREFWYESQETTRYKIAGGNDLLPKIRSESCPLAWPQKPVMCTGLNCDRSNPVGILLDPHNNRWSASKMPEILFNLVQFAYSGNIVQRRDEKGSRRSQRRADHGRRTHGMPQSRSGSRGMPSRQAQTSAPSCCPRAKMFQR
jgi:Flavin containing amine oxidoreductase